MSEPWLVIHNGHRAWAQRALMIGDFSPRHKVPAAWYVVDPEGHWADPTSTPVCETCGLVPPLDQLEAVEVATGDRGFLARSRMLNRWPNATDAKTCWACNCPGAELVDGLLCHGCSRHLGGK